MELENRKGLRRIAELLYTNWFRFAAGTPQVIIVDCGGNYLQKRRQTTIDELATGNSDRQKVNNKLRLSFCAGVKDIPLRPGITKIGGFFSWEK